MDLGIDCSMGNILLVDIIQIYTGITCGIECSMVSFVHKDFISIDIDSIDIDVTFTTRMSNKPKYFPSASTLYKYCFKEQEQNLGMNKVNDDDHMQCVNLKLFALYA